MIMIRTVVANILRLLVPRARTFIIIETGPEKLKLLIVHTVQIIFLVLTHS